MARVGFRPFRTPVTLDTWTPTPRPSPPGRIAAPDADRAVEAGGDQRWPSGKKSHLVEPHGMSGQPGDAAAGGDVPEQDVRPRGRRRPAACRRARRRRSGSGRHAPAGRRPRGASATSQSRTVWSSEPEASHRPVGSKATLKTWPRWPSRTARGEPDVDVPEPDLLPAARGEGPAVRRDRDAPDEVGLAAQDGPQRAGDARPRSRSGPARPGRPDRRPRAGRRASSRSTRGAERGRRDRPARAGAVRPPRRTGGPGPRR